MMARVVSPDLKTELDLIDSQSAKLRMTRLQEVKMPLKSPKKKRLEPPQLVHEEQKATHAVSRSRSAKTSSTAQRVSAIDNFVGNIVQNSSKFSTAAWLPCAHVKQS